MMTVLAYVPFLDPLPIDPWWMVLLLPLVVLTSIVYKTLRLKDLSQMPRQAAWMSLQVISFMVIAAVVVWTITEIVG